jgi:uroporphyrinogen decarboxylase
MKKKRNNTLARRERVARAFAHQEADRCPMQISFTSEFEDRLKQEKRFREMALENERSADQPFFTEQVLGEDILVAWYGTKGWTDLGLQPGEEFVDEWQVKRKAVEYCTRFGRGIYSEFVGHPLAEEKSLTEYVPPDPYDPDIYRNCQIALNKFRHDYYIVGATVTTIFEKAWALRGYDRLLIDFVEDPDLAEAILAIPYHYNLTIAREMVKMGVDMIWTGDDVGTQHGMLISPELWRRFFKPKMAHYFAELKALNPALKIAYHSDGDICAARLHGPGLAEKEIWKEALLLGKH